MNKLIPAFLTQLDSWLLLNYPRVWATRVHYLIFVLLVGSLLAGGAAFVPTVRVINYTQTFIREENVKVFFAIVALPILVYWLMQFRAFHRVFTWKETFLSLLFCAFVSFSFFFFINIYSIVNQIRTSNLMSKQEIEKDLVLAKIIHEITLCRLIKIEDVEIQNYVLKKEESERIYKNVCYFNILADSKLGDYKGINEEELLDLTDQEQAIKDQEIDSLYKIFHFNAVEKCAEVPDSIKLIYLKLSNNRKVLPNLHDDYLSYHLTKISPTSEYLFDKYNIQAFVRTEDDANSYTGNGSMITLLHNLETYFGLQQTHFLERFLQQRSFSFPNKEEEQFEDKQGLFSVTNKRTLELHQSLEDFKEKYSFFDTLKSLCSVLFFPFLGLCAVIHFRRNDILFAILCFIIPFSLNLLGHDFLRNFIYLNMKFYIIIVQFAVVLLFIGYIFINKKTRHIKVMQVFLPFALIASAFCIPVLNQYVEFWQYSKHGQSDIYYTATDYLFELYLAFTILVFPLILMLYHRLAHLPKKQ